MKNSVDLKRVVEKSMALYFPRENYKSYSEEMDILMSHLRRKGEAMSLTINVFVLVLLVVTFGVVSVLKALIGAMCTKNVLNFIDSKFERIFNMGDKLVKSYTGIDDESKDN